MVLGRAGLRLEGQKFLLYIMIPLGASALYNEPSVQKFSADYFQFLKYPSNPSTNLRKQYEELARKSEEERVQRREYQEQLRKLQASAQESRDRERVEKEKEKAGWFGWLRWGGRGSDRMVD